MIQKNENYDPKKALLGLLGVALVVAIFVFLTWVQISTGTF